jgi:hypothetical protein
MTALTEVAALLARLDDDAWVALANRGLLRRARKDLDATPPTLVEETDDAVVVAVGERRVRMPLAGPADATCDCPSPVACQHLVAAGLWLATQTAPNDSSAPDDGAPGDPHDQRDQRDPHDQLHDELMALDGATLTAYAGKAGARWAHQLVADSFAGEQPPRVSRDGYLSVAFARPELVARYPGGGLDGVVLDRKVTQPARWRVAVVLAWQRAHGLVLDPPAPPPASGPTERGLSRDDSRARLRASVRALLEDLVRIGVSHLSTATHERLTTSATWAQGAEYHRLALLLRRLADQVDLALARAAGADDHVLLDEAAVAYGLVCALDAAATRGEAPAHLVGQARTTYDAVRSLDLVGLGGSPWRVASGYHGLTCVFWSPERQRFHTWGDARPEDVPGFDPRARWTQPAPWKGLAAPATTSGRRLVLNGAQVSADGRISGTESTSALVTPTDSDDLISALPVVSAWSGLGGAGPRSLLATGDRSRAWAVLRPSAALPAEFDPARQVLVWPLVDGDDDVVLLELPWSRLNAHAIGRIETLTLPEGALVVARLRRARGAWLGEPLSVVRPDRELNPVDALHFDGEPRSALVGRLLGASVPDRAPDADGTDDTDEGAPDGGVPPPLAALRAAVEQQAQRGCAGVPPGQVRARLATAHRALRDAGWPVFADPPDLDPAALLLRSHYLVQQVERALR